MSTRDLESLELRTSEFAKVLGYKSSRPACGLCDLPDDDNRRLPCIRNGTGHKERRVRLLDLAAYIVRLKLEAAAARLSEFVRTCDVKPADLRRVLISNGIDTTYFPAERELIFLVAFSAREAARIAPNYDEERFDVQIVEAPHDASFLIGRGELPSKIALDLGGCSAGDGLALLYWLLGRDPERRIGWFIVIPEGGLACDLPEGIPTVQRPTDPEIALLEAFPPSDAAVT